MIPPKNTSSVMVLQSQSRLRVVIVAVAFGMGINCPDVSQVIHLRCSCSLLNYAQESGRCGRDGRQAVAKLYYSNREFGICSSKSNRKTTKYQSEIQRRRIQQGQTSLQLSFESQRLYGNTDLQQRQTTCTTSTQQTKKYHLVQPSFQ